MSAPIDDAAPPRAGEALDTQALARWIAEALPEHAGPLEVRQFPAGHSNLTYLLHTPSGELVLRRPPFGAAIRSAHDMGREHRILSRLGKVWAKAPLALASCDDEGVIGAPFYVMHRVRGVVLRRKLPEGLGLDEGGMRRLSEAFVDTMVELHGIDAAGADLADLGRPEGYVQRQIDGWIGRWEKAETDPVEGVEAITAWIRANAPGDHPGALIHNDLKYDNLVLDAADPTRVLAVLDWEMATLGHPFMDLGGSLAYWVQADDSAAIRAFTFGPTSAPGNLTRAGILARYEARAGVAVDRPVFYLVFGLFKLQVIAQQIYRRYRLGHTQDARFAAFLAGVRTLAAAATTVIDRDRIDRM